MLELKSIYLILFLISRLYILIDYLHENVDGKVFTKSVYTRKTVQCLVYTLNIVLFLI